MKRNKVVIGTRGSKLALWQAEWIKAEIEKMNSGVTVELNRIKTTGDKILDVPLAQVGGKGLFVKEIEEALLNQTADMAVHSMKDVPTEFPSGLHLAAICKREDPRDAFVTQKKGGDFVIRNFDELPRGARIGTSSLRRSCQLLHLRSDLQISQLRGNLDTRIRKLDEGLFDAIILAVAGVKRLGWSDRIADIISPEISLPAIGQGAIGIECRIDDPFIHELIQPLNDATSATCVKAERALLKKLEGGCQVPIAAYARIADGILEIDGLVGSVSGDRIIKEHAVGNAEDAEKIGTELAEVLLSKGADKILAEIYGKNVHNIDIP